MRASTLAALPIGNKLAAVDPIGSKLAATPDRIVDRICQLERHIADLQSRLAALEPLTDAAFLKVVATSVQGRVFTATELRHHARVDADLRRALGTLSNVQLGIKLGKLAGRNIGGLVLQRVGRDGSGVLWCVGVADLHDDGGFSVDGGA
jgi:hypothetical protein